MVEFTVLICDDNEAVHESLSCCLNTLGIDVVSVFSGEEAISAILTKKFDLLILDIMLPGISGNEVCKNIRKTSDIPIIILSARGEEFDRIYGFELGTDDYVTKPFSPREVAARVSAILKRTNPRECSNILSFLELQMDLNASEVYVCGRNIRFTPKEKKVIEIFLSNPGVALSRDRLMDIIWGKDYYGDIRAIDTLIKRIRKKLQNENVHFEIVSVYGIGYRLEEKHG